VKCHPKLHIDIDNLHFVTFRDAERCFRRNGRLSITAAGTIADDVRSLCQHSSAAAAAAAERRWLAQLGTALSIN